MMTPTDSVMFFGKFETYRFVDDSSPSALSRELKDSWRLLEMPPLSRDGSATLANPTS